MLWDIKFLKIPYICSLILIYTTTNFWCKSQRNHRSSFRSQKKLLCRAGACGAVSGVSCEGRSCSKLARSLAQRRVTRWPGLAGRDGAQLPVREHWLGTLLPASHGARVILSLSSTKNFHWGKSWSSGEATDSVVTILRCNDCLSRHIVKERNFPNK